MVKNSPHPNAAKVFINWLLGKEGQEIYGKAMGQATRRFDVETKWMVEHGVRASKDFLTVEENSRLENLAKTRSIITGRSRQRSPKRSLDDVKHPFLVVLLGYRAVRSAQQFRAPPKPSRVANRMGEDHRRGKEGWQSRRGGAGQRRAEENSRRNFRQRFPAWRSK